MERRLKLAEERKAAANPLVLVLLVKMMFLCLLRLGKGRHRLALFCFHKMGSPRGIFVGWGRLLSLLIWFVLLLLMNRVNAESYPLISSHIEQITFIVRE